MKAYFTPAIDAAHLAGTTYLDTFVQDKELRGPLQAIVNSYTLFAKDVVSISSQMFDSVSTYDYSKWFKPVK